MTEKEFSQNLGIDIEIFEDGLFCTAPQKLDRKI